jgi:hypothetical protein
MDLAIFSPLRECVAMLGVMLSESEASAFPKGYEKADSSALPQNDVLTQSLMGEDEAEGDQQITPHPRIWSGPSSNLLRTRLCRNAINNLDIMLSESEASAFPTG